MARGAGACWHVVGAGAQACRAHTAREVVAPNHHGEEDRLEGRKMWGLRRLVERHTSEAEKEVGMWNAAQARNRIDENPSVVM